MHLNAHAARSALQNRLSETMAMWIRATGRDEAILGRAVVALFVEL